MLALEIKLKVGFKISQMPVAGPKPTVGPCGAQGVLPGLQRGGVMGTSPGTQMLRPLSWKVPDSRRKQGLGRRSRPVQSR